MSTLLTTTLVFGCLIGAVLLGAVGRRVIPGQHFDSDSRDAVKLALGLVATMAALLLGLLISSAKSDYDTQRRQIVEMAARVATLDRLLELYGPDAAAARAQFRATVESAVRRAWPEEAGVAPDLSENPGGNATFSAVLALMPHDESQAAIRDQAIPLMTDLSQRRALLLAQATTSLSTPLLVIVVCWLFVIQVGFSLLAPPKPLARASLVVSGAVASAAVLLLLELHRPFDGLIRIPSTPIQAALADSAN
jgi:hypothetical protein